MAASDHPKLGLIAGGGLLPRLVADQCRAQGRDVFVLMLDGHAEADAYTGLSSASLPITRAPEGFDILAKNGVRQVVFAGHIARPSLSMLKPSLRTARFLARVAKKALGDDGLLSALVEELEQAGFEVIGAEQIVGGLLIGRGPLGRVSGDEFKADIDRGRAILAALGEQDVGQACVVQAGIVLGIEGAEGTDRLIARSAALADPQAPRAPVLIKGPKTTQDNRVDLPTVGPGTVAEMQAHSFAGMALAAHGVMVLEKDNVIAQVDDAGLFITGYAS